jgi:hypothetical protein
MSIEVFREQVIEVLLLEHPTTMIDRPNRDEIEVRWPWRADDPLTFSVDQAYAWYLKEARTLIPAIERVARYILISSVEPTAEALAIVVQGLGYHPQADAAHPALTRPIADPLLAVVTIDNKYGYQFLSASRLREALALEDTALWDRAMRNTLERLEIEDVPLRDGQPTELHRADGLAASLLVVDAFWDPPRQSEALAVAPVAPNKIIVAPARDTRSLKRLRRAMRDDPLDVEWRRFKGLLVRRAGGWEVLS